MNLNTLDFVTELDGINETIELPTSSWLGSITVSDPMTISCWTYADSTGIGWTYPVTRWDSSTPRGWFFSVLPFTGGSYAGSLRFQYRPHPSGYLDAYSQAGTPFTGDTWHHVAVTLDGTGTKAGTNFYLDGVDVGMAPIGQDGIIGTNITPARPILNGAQPDIGRYQEGKNAELAVFSRKLSAPEILDIYNRGKENPNYNDISDLEHHWMFSELNPVDKENFYNGSNNNMDDTNIIEE
jgi:hypothetical protein